MFKLYEENIGPLTPLIADALKDAEEIYSSEWIADAIELAVKNNKRNWKYCEAILNAGRKRAVPKSKIDETIKKLARVSNEKLNSSANVPVSDLPGDPNCPHCHGVGYLRADVPVGHPDFGKLEVCVCRRANVTNSVREHLFALSHLDELKDLTFETFKPRGRKGLGETASQFLGDGLQSSPALCSKPQWLAVIARQLRLRKNASCRRHCEFCSQHGRADSFLDCSRFA